MLSVTFAILSLKIIFIAATEAFRLGITFPSISRYSTLDTLADFITFLTLILSTCISRAVPNIIMFNAFVGKPEPFAVAVLVGLSFSVTVTVYSPLPLSTVIL